MLETSVEKNFSNHCKDGTEMHLGPKILSLLNLLMILLTETDKTLVVSFVIVSTVEWKYAYCIMSQ